MNQEMQMLAAAIHAANDAAAKLEALAEKYPKWHPALKSALAGLADARMDMRERLHVVELCVRCGLHPIDARQSGAYCRPCCIELNAWVLERERAHGFRGTAEVAANTPAAVAGGGDSNLFCKTAGCGERRLKDYDHCKDCVGYAYGVAATIEEAREAGYL